MADQKQEWNVHRVLDDGIIRSGELSLHLDEVMTDVLPQRGEILVTHLGKVAAKLTHTTLAKVIAEEQEAGTMPSYTELEEMEAKIRSGEIKTIPFSEVAARLSASPEQ